LAGLLLVFILCLAGGVDSLVQHFRGSEPRPYRASSGALLVLCTLVQAHVIVGETRGTRPRSFFASGDLGWLIRFTTIAASVGYAIALLVGQGESPWYILRAWTAACYSGCLWYLITTTNVPSTNSWRHDSRFRRCEIVVTYVVALFVVVEVAMRLQAAMTSDALGGITSTRRQAFDPGSLHQGRRVNHLGYCDDEFSSQSRPGMFRIAALGDSSVFSGDHHTNCVEQIESILPDTEVYNFTLPRLGPREYAAQLRCDVLTYRPDLVLLFLSIENDVTEQLPLPGLFEWRGLRICQWGLQTIAAPASAWHGTAFVETSIDQRQWTEKTQVARFAICRTPIQQPIQQRWQSTLSHLSTIVDICDKRDIPLAFVLLPAAFQVDPALRRRICRRGGYQADHVDLELPQRRLISFASETETPALDLLPELRAVSDRVYEDGRNELNSNGHHVVASVVADWIERSFASRIDARRKPMLAASTTATPHRSASVPHRHRRRTPSMQ